MYHDEWSGFARVVSSHLLGSGASGSAGSRGGMDGMSGLVTGPSCRTHEVPGRAHRTGVSQNGGMAGTPQTPAPDHRPWGAPSHQPGYPSAPQWSQQSGPAQGPAPQPGPPYGQPPVVPGQPRWTPTPLRPVTGAAAWYWGLLALVLALPFITAVASGVVMAIVSRTPAKAGGVARINANRAANWGLTYSILTVIIIGTHMGLLYALRNDPPQGIFPFGWIILSWVALTLVHTAFSIVGGIRAGQGRVVPLNGLPFFR